MASFYPVFYFTYADDPPGPRLVIVEPKPWLEQAEPAVGRAMWGSLKGSPIGSLAWFMVMKLSVCFLMSRRSCFYFVLP
jgi:hypothetical protein